MTIEYELLAGQKGENDPLYQPRERQERGPLPIRYSARLIIRNPDNGKAIVVIHPSGLGMFPGGGADIYTSLALGGLFPITGIQALLEDGARELYEESHIGINIKELWKLDEKNLLTRLLILYRAHGKLHAESTFVVDTTQLAQKLRLARHPIYQDPYVTEVRWYSLAQIARESGKIEFVPSAVVAAREALKHLGRPDNFGFFQIPYSATQAYEERLSRTNG